MPVLPLVRARYLSSYATAKNLASGGEILRCRSLSHIRDAIDPAQLRCLPHLTTPATRNRFILGTSNLWSSISGVCPKRNPRAACPTAAPRLPTSRGFRGAGRRRGELGTQAS